MLISRLEDEARARPHRHVREIRERSRREAEREAKKIIATSAIQRLAVDHSSEITVSVVALPSDDMKGRIIGREGRNIRSFEAATGVDVVVDDTPEAVILSSFDPIRREIARLAMERLVADGRIHPGRIEEMVEKAEEDVDDSMREAAEEVLYELGIHDLTRQLVEVLGKLQVPHQLRPEPAAARPGGRAPGRQHGGRARARRAARPSGWVCCTTSARRLTPRAGGQPRRASATTCASGQARRSRS